MLTELTDTVIAAMKASNNLTIKNFIDAEVVKYAPKNVFTDAMVPAPTTGIAITVSRVTAVPLTVSIAVNLTGISDSVIETNAEATMAAALTAALSPLRAWSGTGFHPSEVTDMFEATLLTRVKANGVTISMNGESIDPEISFGSI
jgi:hypothetical protein